MEKKEMLNAYLEQYPELTDLFLDIIRLKNGYSDWKDLCKLAGYNEKEIKQIDSAIPVDYARQIENIYPDFKNGRNCYDYNTVSLGAMVNLNNLVVKNIFKPLKA